MLSAVLLVVVLMNFHQGHGLSLGLVVLILRLLERSPQQANVTATSEKMNIVLEVAQAVELWNFL
jgi:hypothetical protein